MAWWWLLAALLVGGALLVAAVWVDRRAARTAVEVPARGHPDVDAHVPRYLTQDEVDALPGPAGAKGHDGTRVDAALAHPDFLPTTGRAGLEAPTVLVVDGPVDAMRMLVPVLAAHDALLVVATRWHDDAARTLAANRRALGKQVLAVRTDDVAPFLEAAGADALSPDDLRAGYVPPAALGSLTRVTADRRHVWLQP